MGDSIGLLMMALLSLHSPPAHGATEENKAASARTRCVIAASADTASVSQKCAVLQPQQSRLARVAVPLARTDKAKERAPLVR